MRSRVYQVQNYVVTKLMSVTEISMMKMSADLEMRAQWE